MKSPFIRFLLFFILNFGSLAIGQFATGPGVISDWYMGMNKAPWTPDGWVFGAAWTLIMTCLTVYMTIAWPKVENKMELFWLYVAQLVLSIAWNPVFFTWHQVTLALVLICTLALLMIYWFTRFRKEINYVILLLLPYVIWLLIAVSLNAYVFLNNDVV